MFKKLVERLVDFGGRFPVVVMCIALALMGASWRYASRLELRSDFLEHARPAAASDASAPTAPPAPEKILGNGVNYPIVLYSRYREFRARGMAPDVARREAVWNAFRAELVGASVAAIVYGSLTVTRFRGFSQFGTIGFVGMLLVWLSMIPCVPAMIVLVERIQARLPAAFRQAPPRLDDDGSRGWVSRVVGEATRRRPRLFLALAGVLTVVALVKLPGFLRDPWEYDFHELGSRGSQRGGAGEWSNKAEAVFGGKRTTRPSSPSDGSR